MSKGTGSGPPVVVWFRQDLRLQDHAALQVALASRRVVLPVYVLDGDTPGAWGLGGAGRWWLHHSLASLAESLVARGATLVLAAAGVELGRSYPNSIADLPHTRQRAPDVYRATVRRAA